MRPDEPDANTMSHERVAEHVLRLRRGTDEEAQALLTQLLTDVYPTREVQDA